MKDSSQQDFPCPQLNVAEENFEVLLDVAVTLVTLCERWGGFYWCYWCVLGRVGSAQP